MIIIALVGFAVVIFGILIAKKQLILVVSRHANVKDNDVGAFTKIVGVATVIIGFSAICMGILSTIRMKELGLVTFGIFLISGLLVIFMLNVSIIHIDYFLNDCSYLKKYHEYCDAWKYTHPYVKQDICIKYKKHKQKYHDKCKYKIHHTKKLAYGNFVVFFFFRFSFCIKPAIREVPLPFNLM